MERTYQNPIAAGGDFADPFVLRYNGKYYLYGTNPDVRCWSSDDLLQWKAEGATIEADTFPDMVPFAPEVVYSNGKFYMYTSPSGYGHYILESDKPTGPFVKISGNMQHAIDGSAFIDDDGCWYFYWAGDEGIWGCKMKSPTEFGEPISTGATLHGWTEGPFIYKQNGYYYMTYTGNHYLSKGYRINAAWSTHPLKGYTDDVYNPVIIHTQGEAVGLGHSSTVLGPDLVSHYIIYHNMNEDLSRDLDIDRQLWHEQVTQVLGPTRSPQPAPAFPDYAFSGSGKKELTWQFYKGDWEKREDVYYSGAKELFVMSDQKFQTSFTAEFHLFIPAAEEKNKCGLVLGEKREEYFGLVFEQPTYNLQLWQYSKYGNKCLKKVTLPPDYVFDALHCIRAEYNEKKLTVYIDNRFQLQEEQINLGDARVGYFSDNGQIGSGYTAVTCSTAKESARQAMIPMNCVFYPTFGMGDFDRHLDGSILLKKGEQVQYQLYADCNKEYMLYIMTGNNHVFSGREVSIDDCSMDVWKDAHGVKSCLVSVSPGRHVMKINAGEKDIAISRIYFKPIEKNMESEKVYSQVKVGPYGKKLICDTVGADYTVSARLRAETVEEDSNVGILIRVTEPSEGGEGADPILGIHFFIGYSISFTKDKLIIMRHRYNKEILASCAFEFEINKSYEMKVTVSGDEILVYINEEEVPRLSIRDDEVITDGCVGIWAKNSLITAEDIHFKR